QGISDQWIDFHIQLVKAQVLVDKDEFQVWDQFFQDIQDINHFQVLVDNVVDIAGEICIEEVVQRPGDHFDVDEGSGLFPVSLDRDQSVEVRFEHKLIDHCVKAHGLAVTVNITATHDVRVLLANQSSDMLFATKL